MNTIGQRIGAAIRAERKRQGLGYRELAARSSMHYANLLRVERGDHTPALDVVARVAKALSVKPSAILCVLDEVAT
jgi:transcriptional regulator with XRE-family HTH domain